MRGHFKRRGNSWYFWVELPPGLDGRRRQKSMGGFATRRQAEQAFARFRDELTTRGYLEPTKLTVSQFLDDVWLPGIEATIRLSTVDHYRNSAVYVQGAIGSLPLAKLGAPHLNAMYAQLLKSGRRHVPGPLSPATVRHVHTMIHKALRDAVRWGYLADNPADRADPPVPRRAEMRIWTPEQLRAFLEVVRSDRLYGAWMLLITTGMRRGEVVGLRWDDVDLEHRRLSVVRALITVRGKVIESEPKTAKGRRQLALDPATVEALRSHRIHQLEERRTAGPCWQEQGWVFTREDGTAIHPDRIYDWFNRLVLKIDIPAIRIHDIRHSYASAALAAGIPTKVVSERLGHANVMITLDTYSHVLPGLQEAAAAKVAELILGEGAWATDP